MIRTYRGWFIVPVTDDDTGQTDYYDIYAPCTRRCTQRIIKRVDGSSDYDKCDCWVSASEPEAIAHTIAEAQHTINGLNTEWRAWRALESGRLFRKGTR